MKTMHVMDLDFNYKFSLLGYTSVTLTREWLGIGTLSMQIRSEVLNASNLNENDIVWFNKEYDKAYIIERIVEDFKNGQATYNITATSIKVLIRDFITIPPVGQSNDVQSGARELILRAWVTNNSINPFDTTRNVYKLALGPYNGYGETITEQTRYKNLAEEVVRILEPEALGWNVVLNIPNETFDFIVLEGVDRSVDSPIATASKIIFGAKYGNISNYEKSNDITALKSVAYVGGQGEGADREIVKVVNTTATRKKEIFVDARDATGEAILTERGKQKLEETKPIENFGFEAMPVQYAYEVDYNLGDIVTIVKSKTEHYNKQIIKVTEIYEKNNIRVIPEFGEKLNRLSTTFQNLDSRVKFLETTEVAGAGPVTPTASIPVSTVVAIPIATIPTGWLLCDGSAVDRTTYADLFGALGTAYGVGDGSTTFNLPDLKGKAIVGLDSAQTEFDTLGETGGAKTHTLTVDEIPAHNHGIPASSDSTPDGGTVAPASEDNDSLTLETPTRDAGGGLAHNNLQPYMVLNYIIKY